MLVGVTLLFLTVLSAPWWLVIPIAFVQSSVGQFIGPAENALLPTLVDASRLGAANSLNALNNNLARLVGPALGGLLIDVGGLGGRRVGERGDLSAGRAARSRRTGAAAC